MRAIVHSLLHDQAAWHRARAGDRAVGGQGSRRQDFCGEHERKKNDVPHRVTVRTTPMADWTKLIIPMERRASSPGHDTACVDWSHMCRARRSIAVRGTNLIGV